MTTKITATRQQLAQGELALSLDVTTEVIVSLTPVGIVKLPTNKAAFFLPQSPIPMPQGAIPAVAAAWTHANSLEGPAGIVASHLPNAKKTVSQAHTLARRRALGVWCLAQGKPWPDELTKGATPAVWHRLLRWAAKTFAFDCDLPEAPDPSQAAAALATFRKSFNDTFAESTTDGGTTPGSQDWVAFALCYQSIIAETLGVDAEDLRDKQAKLRTLRHGTLVCDPLWSRDARIQDYPAQSQTRVELLLFAKHCDPLLDEERAPGESIYDDPNYAAKNLPFTPAEVPEPEKPKPPAGDRDLYEKYVRLHKRAMADLLFVDDEAAYREVEPQRETAWFDYVSMSGDETAIIHESLEIELLYRDYWNTHLELTALDEEQRYTERHVTLHDDRISLWFAYEEAGGFRKTKFHTEEALGRDWEFALKHTGHHSAVTAFNLALLSEVVYRPQDEAPKVLDGFVKALEKSHPPLASGIPAFETPHGEVPGLFLPSPFPYKTDVFFDPASDTQGICLVNESHAIVIFRGTQESFDKLVDGEVLQGSFPHSPSSKHHDVHLGFRSGLETDIGDGRTRLGELRSFLGTTLKNGRPIFITGHSLGGALAAYTACALKALEPDAAITVYTFGQPRLCNYSMADDFHGSFNYNRYVHVSDPVPVIPISSTVRALTTYKLDELDDLATLFGTTDHYAHFGSLVEVSDGKLDFKGPNVELLSEASYLELLNLAWDVVQNAKQALVDGEPHYHSMLDSYLPHAYASLGQEGASSRIFLGGDEQLVRVDEAVPSHWQTED